MKRFIKSIFVFGLISVSLVHAGIDMPQPVCRTGSAVLGQDLHFQWTLSKDAMSASEMIIGFDLYHAETRIPLEKEGADWRGICQVPDSNVQVVIFALADHDDYRILPVHHKDGRPVKKAWLTAALFHYGVGNRVPRNTSLALSALESELKHYPDNYDARYYYYALLLNESEYSRQSKARVADEVKEMVNERPKDAALLEFASGVHRLLGDNQTADELLKDMLALEPDGYRARQKHFQTILEVKDQAVRLDSLKCFLTKVQDQALEEYVLTEIINTSIALADTSRLTEYGDGLLLKSRSPGAANALAALAAVLAENQKSLLRAQAYIHKAMSLMDPAQLTSVPPSLTRQQWERKMENTQARYIDILGWIQYHQGDLENALISLEQAGDVLLQPGVCYHLAVVYERLNQHEKALTCYARTIAFEGALAEAAEEALIDLWARVHVNPEGVDQLIAREDAWVDSRYEEKTFENRQKRQAPDFTGEDLQGRQIVLSDQQGSVIVLSFWASWSKASARVLKILQEAARSYGEEVLFLTVALDQDDTDVRKMIRRQGIKLNVMMGNDVDGLYALQGVPTTFLIDAEGMIHFEHRGYRPDFEEVLSMEINDLLRRARKGE